MADKPLDPLEKPLPPVRVNYANGILLDEEDFRAEQAYNRGRLSRALAYLHGSGTVAGLKVDKLETNKHVLRVTAGLAIDRIGRLIELDVPYCLRTDEWFKRQLQDNPDGLLQSFNQSENDAGNKAVVADLFIKFQVCESGMTPSFGLGNIEATDAFTAARLRDGVAFDLILRTMPEEFKPDPTPPTDGLPLIDRDDEDDGDVNDNDVFDSDRSLTLKEGLDALRKFKLEQAWRQTELWNAVDVSINGGPEHAAHQNGTEILLARIRIPATIDPLRYDINGDIEIDETLRVLSLSNFELLWLMNATRGD